jgi:hypothetical protein
MKTQKIRSKPTAIPTSRWAAYAAAGAATALAGISTAEAEIHYSGIVNHPFAGTNQVSSAYFPLNSGANLWFQHFNLGTEGAARVELLGPGGRAGGSIGGLVGTFVLYGGFYVSNLARRVSLSQLGFGAYCRYTSSGSELHCFGGTIGYSQRPNGKFRRPGIGFIGFTFDSGNGPQYGWARIKTDGSRDYHFVLLDYAWADPGESIQVGQRRSAEDAKTPTKSGSLGLLAFGGAGLMAWRKRRDKAAMVNCS